ncbi:MAG: Hsp20/alpha crystallin family protein [Pegethrix bostrychoides GSE-TBD4-15B]|jgi:HSP20 family protein|uniref:Hsp20/alpha crystallin family protein n=1 Tax=Pegethrix bostrychoides GSE-TBD4-15B TaxID=2839662 RepID=A0A951U6T7_9CYAN|nr:Hsp20/alpha crystallin family protein [Pegethrix bostrychoides GSE-TBD4-15B]
MLVRYWQPLREMDTVRRQFDQLFDELTQPTATSVWSPAIELMEAGNSLVLRAQIPGLEAQDLDVEVTQEAVSIVGERRHEQRTEEKGFFKSEFRYGKFRRVVSLPVAIQNDKVQADYKDGILTLTLPKVEETRHKAIKVSLGNHEPNSPELNGHEVAQAQSVG